MATYEEELLKKLRDSIGTTAESRESVLSDAYRYLQSVYEGRNIPADKSFPVVNLIDPTLQIEERSELARIGLMTSLRSKRSKTVAIAEDDSPTQGQSAVAIATILKNPEKFGFTEEDTEKIVESAWYISGGVDELSPEEVRKEAYEKKLAQAKDEADQGRLSGVHKRRELEKEGVKSVTDDELRAQRKASTISYYESLAKDEDRAERRSNTAGELRGVETMIISHAAGKLAKNESVKEAAQKIIGGSEKVSELMSKGETALQMFRDPEGFIATKLANKLGVKSITQAVSAKVIAVLTAKAAGTAFAGIMGAVAPIIGHIAGFIIGKFLNKFIYGAIGLAKRTAKTAVAVAGGLAILLTQGMASAANVAAASAVGSVVVIGAMLALVMFIINSGGYIVPPGPNLGSAPSEENNVGGGGDPTVTENQYIRVVKRPSPSGPFPNPRSGSRTVVDYTIEITALETELTEVTFLYKCEVIKEGVENKECPENNPAIPESPPSQIIPTGAPFVLRYSVAYDTSFSDSIVMDSLLVTATAAGRTTRTSGFASIVFGTPPTRCFDLVGDWPQREQSIMLAAVAQINRAPLFVQKICSRTRVNLRYNPIQAVFQGKPYGGFTSYPNIEFYPLALRNYNSAFYTLAHEIGHIVANTTTLLSLFREAAPYNTEGFICTYPFRYPLADTNQSEDFAEMVAQYYMGQSLSSETRDFTCMSGGNLLTRYRTHFNFALQNVFEERLSWPVQLN